MGQETAGLLEMEGRDDLTFHAAGLAGIVERLATLVGSVAPVTLVGEPGCGRRRLAAWLHARSNRRSEGLLTLELGVGGEDAREELAQASRLAALAAGEFGTLLLVEAPAAPAAVQEKLAAALGSSSLPSPRVLAVQRRPPQQEAAAGRLLPSLAGHLEGEVVRVPPLRERREAVPDLVHHVLARASAEAGLPRRRFTDAALQRLSARRWPGNDHELRAVVLGLAWLSAGESVDVGDLRGPAAAAGTVWSPAGPVLPEEGFRLDPYLADYERALLLAALRKAGGVKSRAARILGINRDRMKYLCRKHGL